jgi:pyruvate,water dikinase
MVNLGLPVPEGFVITTNAFDKFIEFNDIKDQIFELIEKCDVNNTKQLIETSKTIKQLIIKSDYPAAIKSEITNAYNQLSVTRDVKIPEALALISPGREYAIVAVRSSATSEDLPSASFAGQFKSFLNTKGVTDIFEKIKECWASLFEPRAIFYRVKHDFKHVSIAVIVQRMVFSDRSGVMFTVDPSTGENNLVIEATWGLGEMLVSGAVQPDTYIVSRDGKIIDKKIGRKEKMEIRDLASDKTVEISVPKNKIEAQVLTESEISTLVKYGIKLEEHYQKPQDTEFAIENNRIYIVQTRAITTEAKQEKITIEANPILKGLGVSPGVASGIVRIIHGMEDITKVQNGDILVTKMTSPDLVPVMSKCSAIITDSGGVTSHAAIVSREMGIPCVVGTHTATKTLKDGMEVTVDSYNGLIYPGKIEIEKPLKKEESVPSENIKTKTSVKVNLAFVLPNLEEIASKADGVGLLRIEHLITKAGIHPAKLVKEGRGEEYIKILLDVIEPIAKAFYPKPVWVRTLDARSDEFRNLEGGEDEPKEDNPMLGWHGIRRSLDEPELLKTEFEAIKRLHQENLDNVHVMLPFIISVDEFKKAREIAKESELPETVKLGIMVEVPSCALTIEDFCEEGIAFASVGSNDLTQTSLGIDRNNAQIASLYSELHPAVLKMIRHVIHVCNEHGVDSSICGEAPSNRPEMVEFLVKAGISSISVNIDAIDKVRVQVNELEKS